MTFDFDMDSLSVTLDSLKEQRSALLSAAKKVISDSILLGSDSFGHCQECGASVIDEPILHTTCALGELQKAMKLAEE